MADAKVSVYWDEPLETTLTCLAAGWATFEEIEQAVDVRRQSRPMIGKLALTYRKLTMGQVFQILKEQATSNELFGEIAIRLGFVSTGDLQELLQLQASLAPQLRDVLVSMGVITPGQAGDIRERTMERLRQRHQQQEQAYAATVVG